MVWLSLNSNKECIIRISLKKIKGNYVVIVENLDV